MAVIEPIADRQGHVGGIESMVVDGRRWFFGFDYRRDMVVSPLIDDPAQMAQFASEHMLQTDGPHDVAYWREMADTSIEVSDIAGDDDRTYDSQTLVAQRLSPSYQLQYLMGAATGWGAPFFEDEAVRAGLTAIGVPQPVDGWDYDWDCIELVIAAAASDDTERSRVGADLLTRYHRHIFDSLPANWPEVFAALRPS